MIKRTVVTGLATAALASTTLMLAGPAQAADDSTCSITDVRPHQAVIGVEGKRVQFSVTTTCDDQDIKFYVRGAGVGTTPHAFRFAACNYAMVQGPTNFDCTHDGSGVIDPIGGWYIGPDPYPGNYFAGPNPIYADAFVDANHNGKDDDGGEHFAFASTINLLRKTQFDGTFNASPEPARKGKPIKVSATLSTADWNDGTWAHIDAPVKIEFKAAGQNSYKTVKTVTATDGQVDTTVTAKRSGTWRASYAGSDVTAASASNGDYVKVK